MSEHCCKHEQVEVDFKHPQAKKIARVPASTEELVNIYKQAYDETSHPAYPKKDKPAQERKVIRTSEIDWHGKYLQVQRELVEEAGRWSRRLQELEVAYAEKMHRLEQHYESALEQGFEEAYKLLLEERKKSEGKLQEELSAAQKVAEQGYAEAFDIIQQLQQTNTELVEQLAHNKTKDENGQTS